MKTLARLIVVIALCVGWALPTHAAVVFDANATATCTNNGVTSINCSTLTVGSGSNRALVCQVNFSLKTVASVALVWDNGGTNQAMTQIVAANGTGSVARAELWGLVAPTSGAKQARLTWTGSSDVVINCVSWTGADQTGGTTSFAHSTSATGSATPAAITITSAVGNATMETSCMDAGTVTTTTQTSTFVDNNPTNISTGGSRAAGAATVTHSRTVTGGPPHWVTVGVDIVAGGGAATPGCKNGLLLLGAGCDEVTP